MAKSLNAEAKEGHNSSGMIDGAAARGFLDRLLSLESMSDDINADKKEVYAEAKEAGFVPARLRERVKEERTDPDVLWAKKAYMDMLDAALGEFAKTALGKAAKRRRGPSPREEVNEQAPALLEQMEDPEAKVDADFDRIIGAPAGAA